MTKLVALFLLIAMPFSVFADEYDNLYSPENVYAPVNVPIPENTRQAGPNEFYNRYMEGILILDTPLKANEAQQRLAGQNRQTTFEANKFLALNRPTFIYRISGIRDGIDAPVQYKTALGETKRVILMGRIAVLREMIGAQLMYKDRNNQRAIYDYLHARLAGTPGLPVVPDVMTADAATFSIANDTLLQAFEAKFGRDAGGRAVEGFGVCESEEGGGEVADPDDGDQTGKVCDANATGLYTAGDWALKYANTCVRNQGERGTGSAFALTAAIESRVARDEKRFSNFSEQHLFHLMTSRWFRVLPDNEDNIAPILSSGITTTIGYGFHFEDIWSYNPSYDRTKVDRNGNVRFGNSCHWYDGRQCSDTNHQGRMMCVVIGPNRYCGYDAPMPLATPVKINNMAVVFDVANPDVSLQRARRWLRAGVPLVMTFGVPASMFGTKTGYLGAGNESERYLGGHAALITGFVPNHLRPPGTAEAAGGGYFVMKNSWGRCVGDSGYFYLPLDWVQANAINFTAVF